MRNKNSDAYGEYSNAHTKVVGFGALRWIPAGWEILSSGDMDRVEAYLAVRVRDGHDAYDKTNIPSVEIHSQDSNRLAASAAGFCLALFFGAGWRTTFDRCHDHGGGCVHVRSWRPV